MKTESTSKAGEPTQKPFEVAWRVVNDPEEIHQYRAVGGRLYCPAILGGCGPSMKHPGKFWANAKQTSLSERSETTYHDSIEAARKVVETHLRSYVISMKGGC